MRPPAPLSIASAVARGVATLASAVFGSLALGAPGPAAVPVGVVTEIVCGAAPEQSYALYLPRQYTPARRWPIVYCFDPLAQGHAAVARFQAAAEARGYIVAGSNNSHNGPWSIASAAAAAMCDDTAQRFAVDPARCYAAGFSGGARVACAVAGSSRFAGVLACSGGFPEGTVPAQVPFVFFGTAGREDFNFGELERLRTELVGKAPASRVVVFAGAHEWAPPEVLAEALRWFDFEAARQRGLPVATSEWDREYLRRLAAARQSAAPDERAAELRSIVADFAGLRTTEEAGRDLANLERSRDYRRAVSAARKAIVQERDWEQQLAEALQPQPAEESEPLARPFAEPERPSPFATATQNGAPDFGRASAPQWPGLTPMIDTELDPLAAFRRVVTDVRRRRDRTPAAGRALGRLFVTCATDGEALLAHSDYPAAARAFEAASIVNPDSGWVYVQRARVALAQDRRGEARELLQTAMAKGNVDARQLEPLQIALGLAQPRRSAAPVHEEESVRVAPNNPPDATTSTATDAAAPTNSAISASEPAPPQAVAAAAAPPRAEIDARVKRVGTSGAPRARRSPPNAPLRNAWEAEPMEAFRVSAIPIGSFGLGLQILARPETRQIARVYVKEVAPGSDADANGVAAGDEIVRVDGRPITSFVAGFDRTQEFGRLFIGRTYGERITLEITTRTGRLQEVTLTEGISAASLMPWQRPQD